MKPLRFEGYGDDTFGEYGRFRIDMDNCANGKPHIYKVSTPSGEGFYVWGEYDCSSWPKSSPGCWMIGVQQLDAGIPIPAWPMRFEKSKVSPYSVALVIEAPEDVVVVGVTGEPQ